MFVATKGKPLAATVTGSLPRPAWYRANLYGRAFSVAMSDLIFREQQNGSEPSLQRQMRIIEDRSRSNGELIFTFPAIELFAGLNPKNVRTLASWTLNTFRPAQLSQNLAAFIVGIEQPSQV